MENKLTISLASQIGDLALEFEREKRLSVSIKDKTAIDAQTTPMYDKQDNQRDRIDTKTKKKTFNVSQIM